MRIIYMGNNQRGIRCLEALAGGSHEIPLAIAQTGEPGWYEAIDRRANELGIASRVMDKPNTEESLDLIRSLEPDLIVMCGYSKILKQPFLDIPKRGCINLHASKLPKYRGAAPLNWAIINGERELGLSIYQVDAGIDTGPLYAQETFSVGQNQTIRDVLRKTLELYPPMLLRVCDGIENGTLTTVEQDHTKATAFPRRRPKDGLLNFNQMTDIEVHNMVRALTHPYPGAFFYSNGEKYYVWSTQIEDREYTGPPGKVVVSHVDGVTVLAKNKGLRLGIVQKEEEPERSAKQLFKEGDLLENKDE